MRTDRVAWLAIGASAAAVSVGVGEIVAALSGGASIVAAVGALVIALQPPGGKDLMVALFGVNDKLALEVGVFLGGVAVGALLGPITARDARLGAGGFVAFGLLALSLLIGDPLADPVVSALTVGAAVAAGLALLYWLGRGARPARATTVAAQAGAAAGAVETVRAGASREPHGGPALATATRDSIGPSVSRRGFIGIGAVFVAAGGVLAFIGRYLGTQLPSAAGFGPAPAVPAPAATVPPIAAGSDFGIDGLTPIVVSNERFYRIDTRLTPPRLDAATWSLRLYGMVERELTLTYADLLAMPLVERYVTIACVSNDVGGYLVGNAKWTGVSLVDVLKQADVRPSATQLVGRSFDGWTCGFPTAHLAGAGRESMIAVQMNGEPLPIEHGYPARLIVPGLYGYVSATKWLTEIELTTLEAFDAYWVPLGWAKEAPILTQSRIDLPRNGTGVAAGQLTVAGVAWAPTRGIAGVEIQLDDGNWLPCELSLPLSEYAWIQWRATVDMPVGQHTLRVRATDGTGAPQAAERTPPAPDGARGYHQIRVTAA